MLSREKVIHNNIYLLKIDSPKNLNYRAGNIRHTGVVIGL